MRIAYFVCFVALLQVSTCETESLGSAKSSPSDSEAPFDSESLNSSESTTTEIATSESTTVSVTTDEQEVESLNYTAVVEVSTDKEEEVTTEQPSSTDNHAVVINSSVLALFVPVCLRLLSIKLLGVV